MKKLLGTFIIFCGLTKVLWAQDPAFSQLFNNRVYMNPTFAGLDEGHRVALSHRSLWRNLPRNFVTSTFTYDFKPCAFPRIGLGLIAMTDNEGDGRLKSTEAGFIFAFHTPYSLNKRRKDKTAGSFSFSLQTTYITRNVDWNKLVFGDQIDPVLGVVTPRSLQAQLNFEGVNNTDFATGFLWRQRIYRGKKMDMTFHFGFATHHVFKPQVGLLINGIMPQRYTLHSGLLVPISKNSYVVPAVRYMTQDLQLTRHSSIDVNVMYLNRKIFGGFSYRLNQFKDYKLNTDAAMFFVGYELEINKEADVRLTYSFDTNFKGVSTGNFYTHEVSLVFVLSGKCKSQLDRFNKNICDYEGRGLPRVF